MTNLFFCCLSLALVSCAVPPQPSSRYLPQARPQGSIDSRLRLIGNVPPGPKKYTLYCLSDTVCWTGDALNQWRTDDGGKSWQLIYSGNANSGEISTFEYIDQRLGWLLTIQKLYKTEDGGRNWLVQAKPWPDHPLGELRTIDFLTDGKIGWAGGGSYRPMTKDEKRTGLPRNITDPPSNNVLAPAIFRTEDSGRTWTPQSFPSTTGRIYDLTFLNAQQGVALESSGPFYTKNGGNEWRSVDFKKSCTNARYLEGYDMRALQVFFLDSRNAWMSFEDGRIAKSADGGQSWCDLLQPNAVEFNYYEKYFKKIHFATLLHGWGLGANGLLYETSDGGKAWAQALSIQIDDMSFLNDGTVRLISKAGLFQISS